MNSYGEVRKNLFSPTLFLIQKMCHSYTKPRFTLVYVTIAYLIMISEKEMNLHILHVFRF